MQVDIYIREIDGNREIRIPWLPDEIKYGTGETSVASYEILDKGVVEIPTGVGISNYSWESIFPGVGRQDSDCGLMRGSWKAPTTYHNILTQWKESRTKLNLLVTGYPINKTVFISNYTGTASGGFGDITYTVDFKEWGNITVSSSKNKQITKSSSNRSSNTEESSTYVVKSGDTLWGISQKVSLKWSTLYNMNKEIIEKTATERWKAAGINRGSQHGKWIFPGTKLLIK